MRHAYRTLLTQKRHMYASLLTQKRRIHWSLLTSHNNRVKWDMCIGLFWHERDIFICLFWHKRDVYIVLFWHLKTDVENFKRDVQLSKETQNRNTCVGLFGLFKDRPEICQKGIVKKTAGNSQKSRLYRSLLACYKSRDICQKRCKPCPKRRKPCQKRRGPCQKRPITDKHVKVTSDMSKET